MTRMAAVVVLLAALFASPAVALAQGCPRTTLGDIEDEVMCPVCGTPLGLATEAPQANRQRDFIQGLVEDCRSKEEIKTALVAQFGDEVLALPGDGDSDLGDVLVYAVPAAGGLLGTAGIALAVLRWRRRERAPGSPSARAASSARLDSDLERYDL